MNFPGVRRVPAVDILRGLVMVIMAIDHTRDYVHSGAMNFRPDDLTQTTAAIFLTRWITHFCAPAFALCAGLGAALRLQRGRSKAELSRYLVTRGLWLIVLELTAVRLAFFFNVKYDLVFLLVFWSLGLSLIALAALIYLPMRALAVLSVAMIALHNLADPVTPARLGSMSWFWIVLHQPGLLHTANPTVIVGYPLVPWIGVVSLGYCLGHAYALPPDRRRALFLRLGFAITIGFVVLRWLNAYGDPRPWASQASPMFTVLSFLSVSKYPPSLLFLMMTLGPALLSLGLADRAQPRERNAFLVFGRTPQFYFVAHLALLHAAAVLMTWLRYGVTSFTFQPPPTVGSPRAAFPADYGWDLWVVYAVTASVVIALYPVCLWLSRLKASRKSAWVSYL